MPLQQLVQHDAIEESTQAEPKENAGVAELDLIDGTRHPTSRHAAARSLSLAAACTARAGAGAATIHAYFGAEPAPGDPTPAFGGGVSTVLKIARPTLLTSRHNRIECTY